MSAYLRDSPKVLLLVVAWGPGPGLAWEQNCVPDDADGRRERGKVMGAMSLLVDPAQSSHAAHSSLSSHLEVSVVLLFEGWITSRSFLCNAEPIEGVQ